MMSSGNCDRKNTSNRSTLQDAEGDVAKELVVVKIFKQQICAIQYTFVGIKKQKASARSQHYWYFQRSKTKEEENKREKLQQPS